MGVAGSGKTTIGRALAARHGAFFIEGDDFHPSANVAKMAAGEPLTDEDRWPWLARIVEAMRSEDAVVVACSALKRAYRDELRSAGDVSFVVLLIDRDEARQRVATRPHHFMGPSMVDSQFELLEMPTAECDVATVSSLGERASVLDRVESAVIELRARTTG